MSERFFSLVLLKSAQDLSAAVIAERIQGLAAPIGASVSVLQDAEGDIPAILEVGGVKISLIAKAGPVPTGTLEGAAQSSIAWPGAKEAVAVHTAHAIVGCLDLPNDHEQALHFAIMTTFATAAVLDETSGIGVYWSTGQMMIDPVGWRQAAQTILAKDLPVEDWVLLYWQKGNNGTIGAVTEGARAFFGMEIEFAPAPLQPADIAGKLFGVVRYLLINGAVLKDGDTLGQSETEMIRVRFKDHGAQFDGRVIELSVEGSLPQPAPLPGLGGAPYATPPSPKSNRPTFGKRGRG